MATEDGSIGHGEIRIGDTVVLAFDRSADWPVMPSLLRVFVTDVEEKFSRAVAAGARVVTSAEAMKVAQETFDAEMSGRGSGRSSAPVRPGG